jgi:hypothetical protein
MDSSIILNDRRLENIGNMEFHTTGLTRGIAFAMDKIAYEKGEDV